MSEIWLVLLIVCSVALIIIVSRTSSRMNPIKWIWTGVINVLIGALGLYFLNMFGQLIGFTLPINLFTAGVAGILGIPGLVALILSKLMIGL
jgi:inhibitor of the pro-sigma K processing machinery